MGVAESSWVDRASRAASLPTPVPGSTFAPRREVRDYDQALLLVDAKDGARLRIEDVQKALASPLA
jgi:hypothetical protein